MSRFTLSAAGHLFSTRVLGREPASVTSLATRSWEIAPGETRYAPPAHFLPGQLERVTGWMFSPEHPRREMQGGYSVDHSPTRAWLVENVSLIDGALYKAGTYTPLAHRSRRLPEFHVDHEIEEGAICCTLLGNRYFGNWLMDDCPLYFLAQREGTPVTLDRKVSTHMAAYESLFDMKPIRLRSVFARRLIVFEDIGQNRHKHDRFRALGAKALAGMRHEPHPGVFILRGWHGERRTLVNELELAEHLRKTRGFRIVDPMSCDVPTILAACAGARVVAGIEGSQLIHGLLALPPGGGFLILQPPNRFVTLLKHLTDRDGQHFGFVVGTTTNENGDFRVSAEEMERTLDLFPPTTRV